MVGVELAKKLHEAGMEWRPAEHDAFMIPGAGLDQKVFIISELTALVQRLAGEQHITFHGSSEWALDHVMVSDAVWLPSETQLRKAFEERIPERAYSLEVSVDGYRCRAPGLPEDGPAQPTAEDAYAMGLLQLLGRTE